MADVLLIKTMCCRTSEEWHIRLISSVLTLLDKDPGVWAPDRITSSAWFNYTDIPPNCVLFWPIHVSCQRYKCVVRITVIYGPAAIHTGRGTKTLAIFIKTNGMTGWQKAANINLEDSSRWAIRRSNKVIECIIMEHCDVVTTSHPCSWGSRLSTTMWVSIFFYSIDPRKRCPAAFATEAKLVKVEILLFRAQLLNRSE